MTPDVKRKKLSAWKISQGWPAEIWEFGYLHLEWQLGFVRRLGFHPGYYTEEVPESEAPAPVCDSTMAVF